MVRGSLLGCEVLLDRSHGLLGVAAGLVLREHERAVLKVSVPAEKLEAGDEGAVVHVCDLHATMLHLVVIDHERFSVKHQGLDARLTGVEKARMLMDVLL